MVGTIEFVHIEQVSASFMFHLGKVLLCLHIRPKHWYIMYGQRMPILNVDIVTKAVQGQRNNKRRVLSSETKGLSFPYA
jgi:hypothetical protein